MASVSYVRQKEPLGLGDAILDVELALTRPDLADKFRAYLKGLDL